MVSANFSSRLKELMDASIPKTTQQDLAKILNLTRQQISNYTTGRTSPDPNTICILAKHFNVTTDYLLGLRNIKSPDIDIQAIHNKTGLSEEAIAALIDLNWRYSNPNFTSNSFEDSLEAYMADEFLEFYNYMIEDYNCYDCVLDIIKFCNTCDKLYRAKKIENRLIPHMHETFVEPILKDVFQGIAIDDGRISITVTPEEAKYAILGNMAEEFKTFINKYAEYKIEKNTAVYKAESTENNNANKKDDDK